MVETVSTNPGTGNQMMEEEDAPGFFLHHQVIFLEATMHLCQWLLSAVEPPCLSSWKNGGGRTCLFQPFAAFLIAPPKSFAVSPQVVFIPPCEHS